MTEFHCNCGATITGTKRDVATHLAGCATIRANTEQAEAARQERLLEADGPDGDPACYCGPVCHCGDGPEDGAEYDEFDRPHIPTPRVTADSDDRRATSCSHYGEHVPEDFTGCARCLLAQECYDEYVKRAREVA
jgi:hypothetical protein